MTIAEGLRLLLQDTSLALRRAHGLLTTQVASAAELPSHVTALHTHRPRH